MALPYNPALKARARELRKAGNLSEVLFWNQVKNKQFNKLDFDRQKIIGNYIVDFYCADCNVVIEIDGDSHDRKQEEDTRRDEFLKNLGLHVIRIADVDVRKNIEAVMAMLARHPALTDTASRTTPTPPQEGNNHPAAARHPSTGGEPHNSPPMEGDFSNSPPVEGDFSNSPPVEGDFSNSPPVEGDFSNSPPVEGDFSNSPPVEGAGGGSLERSNHPALSGTPPKEGNDYPIQAIVLKAKDYAIDNITAIINNEENAITVLLSEDQVFALIPSTTAQINQKIDANHAPLESVCFVGSGMQTAADAVFLFDDYPKQFPSQYIKKRITGKNVDRYVVGQDSDYILYFEDVDDWEKLPVAIQKHLKNHESVLSNRATVRYEGRVWWKYSRPMHKELYHLPKLYCSRRAFHNTFCFDSSFECMGFSNMTVIFETNPDVSIKYVLALLNSQLLNFRYKSIGKQTGGGSFEYFPNGVGKLPIPQIGLSEQQPFIVLAEKMLSLHIKLREERKAFLDLLADNFDVTIAEKRFDDLAKFKDFLDELKRQKIELPLGKQPQWKKAFGQCKGEVDRIRENIQQTDAEIDRLVYALYGLNEEEIAMVEGQGPQS
ncbi:MAG: DUF559 domain-containing protein [Planctomycetaceae bacterium]|jgi:very-short-patch-repair endonuclease|nr:DUF559 domain-containing protein [Planctomycetaceae bacterium]